MTPFQPFTSPSMIASLFVLGGVLLSTTSCSSEETGSPGAGGAAKGGSGGASGGVNAGGAGGAGTAGSKSGGASTGGGGASTGGASTGGGGAGGGGGSGGGAAKSAMTFFLTSAPGPNGANFAGLAGADTHCQTLAAAAGGGDHMWHAYLSTSMPAVNAKDRIGTGPWVNKNGVTVATSPADLHSANNKLGKANSVDETGMTVNGGGDEPNRHDILTGSMADGTAYPDGAEDHTCDDWKSTGAGNARVGHHDKMGGGADPMSWNSAHDSQGCTIQNLRDTGGDGRIYCFAID